MLCHVLGEVEVSANMSGGLMQIRQWSEMYLQTCLGASCRYVSGQKCICKHVWKPYADTSVVRNVSANMSGSLMQIHKWSEMYLQTCLEASCRYISDQKCICKHAWKSHVDTSVVRNVSANASGSFVQIHRR